MYDRIVAHPWMAPLKPAWQRSRCTTTPLRFFAREALLRRTGVARYRLREAPHVPLSLRHLTPDLEVLDEVFVQRVYVEPPAVAQQVAALGRPPVVLDLGANVGVSAAWFAVRWPGARLVCVEPDPANLAVLRDAAAAAGWRIVAAAAAAQPGTLRFRGCAFAASRADADGELEVEAIDALALAAGIRADVLKMDMEGGEWPLLCDARLADLPAIAVALEYHPHLCPGPNARAEASRRLQSAGFEVHDAPAVAGAEAVGVGSLWAWRP